MKKVLVLVLMVFAIGCAKKYVKPVEEPAEVKEEVITEEVRVVEEKTPPREIKEVVSSVEKETPFEFKDALFDFDKYDIRPDARAILNSTAAWLNKNKNLNVLIEGHCDERGTNEYNLALGEKRAKAAKNYLIAKGIAPLRMKTISYGEERPLCTLQNENCWQKNRRAHFIFTK